VVNPPTDDFRVYLLGEALPEGYVSTPEEDRETIMRLYRAIYFKEVPTSDVRSSPIDARVLREAALILRRRCKKPESFWVEMFCRVLEGTADGIEKGSAKWSRSGSGST
jgi:hypothetical protein